MRRMQSGFWAWALGFAGVGLIVRLLYVLATPLPHNDGVFYSKTAITLAREGRYLDPGNGWPTAWHPPLYSAVLAVPTLFGLESFRAQQLIGASIGALTVLGAAAFARAVTDARGGVAVAAVVALSPALVVSDSIRQSESLYGALVAALLLAAWAARLRPVARSAVVLGVLGGLTVLTRSDGGLLVALLALVAFWSVPRRGRLLAVTAMALLVVLTPWAVRNSLTWHGLVGTSTSGGAVIAGANCPLTYAGDFVGMWRVECQSAALPPRARWPDEPFVSAHERRIGVRYARANARRLVVVAAIRPLRTWGLWPLGAQIRANAALRGIPHWAELVSWIGSLLVGAGALVGGWQLWREGKRAAVALLACAPVAVTLTSVLSYGTTRFRCSADVALAIAAGLGAAAWLRRRRPSEDDGTRVAADARAAEPGTRPAVTVAR